MTDSMTCPTCGTRYTAEQKAYPAMRLVGDDAASLRVEDTRSPNRQLPNVPTPLWSSKTGQRLMQSGVSAGVAAAAWWHPGIITLTGATVWFVSLIGGSGNWGVVKDLLDRNKDGRVDIRDLRDMVRWWKDDNDEPDQPKPPDIVVPVASGSTVTRQRITGTTEQQWIEAAFVMASVTHKDGKFSRNRVGYIFGSDKEFGRVQQEMVTATLLTGGRYTGYRLTSAGRAFLAKYRPPAPDEVE